jgi:diguanylate cyclase (GGDEF)-like protein/PAS domain S-box-containing protein
LRLEDDGMDHLQRALTKELATSQVNGKIQKILFDIIFQHVHDMVYVMKVEKGPDFRYIFVNESGLNQANLPIEVIGKTMTEALPPEFAKDLKKNYEKVLSYREIVSFDDTFSFDDGRKIYGETILTPIFNEKNKITHVVAVTRDVTAWTIEKNKIIVSEQRYRSIVDNNLDAIFSINLEGKILEANPAAAMMTGYIEKQMINRSIYNLINDWDLESFRQLLEKTCSGYALESFDCKFIHRNGKILLVHLKTVPIVIHGEISGVYVICKDLSEQVKSMETIKYMAFHDQLTGLLNRRALLENLSELIASNREEFALLSIDLDRFKYINDTIGHIGGDEILKKVADRLGQYQNKRCFVYRQGGDEFNILLLKSDRKKAAIFVQQIFSAFVPSIYYNSQEYFITPSIGISMFPNDGMDSEMLIKNADEALFRVKEKGKAHYQFYRTEMNSESTNIVMLETHLRKAIEKNELTLFFQPQIDLQTGKARSFEALLRWSNPVFGLISPALFIPLAEDTGLIISIGHWVIESACKQIREWNKLGYHDVRVAVNISPKQFQQHQLIETICLMIKKYEIQSSSLEIEITEGSLNNTKETIPILKRLKEIGIKISVDDFGTGYSSLNYLREFPIDILKIDRSFIKDVLVNEKVAAITTTIIHLGRSLGMEVIAEGVESREQVDFLLKAQCHKIQGFYYSKPIPAKELEQNYLGNL